ncbi:acyl carrier protein [Streptomyces sp. AP-93]|uniref:acyl carrier protein n=1 Tax=Streptomyces sp. AP-93 TaxID=2929048 RepID=UPI001FAF2B8D|nr:acyl carrier protein [Streptomyces sp. AP-93]MCJ0871759.1 acyl carrier protein [Streptomyces sp. AP-93]
MSEVTVAATTKADPQEIRDWLVHRVAYFLECPVSQIDATAHLVEIGLDSVYALTLCGDVEDRFGLLVEPTMAWDHPTVDAITVYLAGELERL